MDYRLTAMGGSTPRFWTPTTPQLTVGRRPPSILLEIVGTTIPTTLRTECASLFDHIYLQKTVTEKGFPTELAVFRYAIANGEVTNLQKDAPGRN